MLGALNNFCRRLWRDESGVVLALTVVVFLTLFVIACTVYAVGEHIRQRIELQNAADAAAYSGAVVQADALSRIAAINKAMAWTYVQMGRAVMDYDVDAWLELTLQKYRTDYMMCLGQISPYSSCPFTYLNSWIGSAVGWYPACQFAGQIQINQGTSYTYSTLELMWMSGPHWPSLAPKISEYRKMIKDMIREENSTISNLEGNVRDCVTTVLQENVGYPNPNDCWYSVVSMDPSKYFKTLTDEKILLEFLNPPVNALSAFEAGCDDWFNDAHAGDGIQRHYDQGLKDRLRADWRWHLEAWIWTEDGPYQLWTSEGSDTVRGSDAEMLRDPLCYETERIKPQILTRAYFEPLQHILVSVARKLENPLAFMFQPGAAGLFGFFEPGGSPGGKSPYAWAAAAARAGYRDGGAAGEYWTEDQGGWLTSPKNLTQWDWDAVLIPLHKPAGTGQVIPSLWSNSQWRSLHSAGQETGLGSLASGAAPTGNVMH